MSNSSNDGGTSYDNKRNKQQERLVDEEKIKVKKQIDDLKKLISDIDFQLEITTYGEYNVIDKSPSQISDTRLFTSKSQIKNIDDILQYELHKMSGIYCSKAEEDEFVFNFSPSSCIKSTYAVQVFTEGQTVKLGNYVMPWGMNIDNIVSETSLEDPKDIVAFLRNFKRNIDCHAERTKQFDEFKQSTSLIKNLRIDATLGYITVLCYFLNIHDNSTDKNFDLSVKMYYGSGGVRPSIINFEWNLEEELSKQTAIKMKTFAKYFKTQSLSEAFKSIVEKHHPIYAWKPEEYDNSVLDSTGINNSFVNHSNTGISDKEDEEYLPKQNRKNSIRKRDVKRLSGKRTRNKKLNQKAKNAINSDGHDDDNELSQNITDSKPLLKKRKKQISSLPINNKSKISPKLFRKNAKSKLHQTKLNFISSPVSRVSINIDKKKKAITSTPMNLRHVTNQHQSTVESLEISPITEESAAEVNTKIRTKQIVDQRKKKKS